MLILLEGPDEVRNDQVSAALRYYHEGFLEMMPREDLDVEDGARFRVQGYVPGREPSVILREWHWTTAVVNDEPPFSFKVWKAIETALGRRGALAVYVAPPEPDPEWDLIVDGSRLPRYRIEADANLNLAIREALALAGLLSDRTPPKPDQGGES